MVGVGPRAGACWAPVLASERRRTGSRVNILAFQGRWNVSYGLWLAFRRQENASCTSVLGFHR